jgi:hypothetical protein
MKRRSFLKSSAAAGLVTLITPSGILQAFTKRPVADIEADFMNPPTSAFAQTWWHWMNGNITKEGITLDLEAMKRVGLGGFQNFDAGTGIPKGPVIYLSDKWFELKKHTINEAMRLGLEFTMANCPGWSSSGGPWITPELAMQQLSWSETFLTGGTAVNTTLPQPFKKLDYYKDIAILAYPSLKGEAGLSTYLARASTAEGVVDIKKLNGQDAGGITISKAANEKSAWILFEFANKQKIRSLSFINYPIAETRGNGGIAEGGRGGARLTLEVSDDGQQFRTIPIKTENIMGGEGLVSLNFEPLTAKYVRLSNSQARRYEQFAFTDVERNIDWMKKANFAFQYGPNFDNEGTLVSTETHIDPASIIDLTSFVGADGLLKWAAPVGNWTVLRIGYTPIGALNHSAPDTGIGLDCDKYNAQAIEFHFNKMMQNLLPALAPLADKGKVGLLIDSYEIGMQNWTALFPQDFEKKTKYSITKFLPALTGRIIGGNEQTDRFLWDFRRVQADLMADNYYGKFTELCHQHKITSYVEPYDRGPMEEMQIGARVDVPMGEFWNGLSTLFQNNYQMRRTTKLAASIAHINGKTIVGAESFTSEPESARWQEYPFGMKALGDKMFTQGLNRIIFHRYAHQPHPTALPGMTMGPWGIHFDRTNTWWEQSRAWLKYLARCQYLLQQGKFVADLLYFTTEESDVYTRINRDELNPQPPIGYDYDLVNTETVLSRLDIKDHQIALPDGMSYRVFILQDVKALTVGVLRKLIELVDKGMYLIGTKPVRSRGLKADNAEFNELTAKLWGDKSDSNEYSYGKGKVFLGLELQAVLDKISIKPDVIISSRSGDAPVLYIHRKVGDTDIYFLSNQRRNSEELVCSFRVNGKQPELWDADTGVTLPLAVFETANGRINIPISMAPSGSVFIIFREASTKLHVSELSRNGQTVLSTENYPDVKRTLYKELAGNFAISFWAKPESNVMLAVSPAFEPGRNTWTDFYAIYPSAGRILYGEGHATAGCTVGRNGVAIWENSSGDPVFTLAAPVPISGWSHIALIYRDNVPSVYVNGKLVKKGSKSAQTVHPGTGQAYLQEGASYYNGDMSEPQVIDSVIDDAKIESIYLIGYHGNNHTSTNTIAPIKDGLVLLKDGKYAFKYNSGKATSFAVQLSKPIDLSKAWQVSFPADRGAPTSISLPQLASLHLHETDGVKHFSGTCTYTKTFQMAAHKSNRVFLNLGSVAAIAELKVNGKDFGILWKRPFEVDISNVLKAGTNHIEVKVTNLWPNRLIGDEQFPEENEYTPGGGASGFASLINGAIVKLPEWYMQGKPKPKTQRVTFTTWKHYKKDDPLLESGLIGPVTLSFGQLYKV